MSLSLWRILFLDEGKVWLFWEKGEGRKGDDINVEASEGVDY